MENNIKDLLCSLKICDENSWETFYPRVRDRDDIAVLRCKRSGVICLSRSDHMHMAHYQNQGGFEYWWGAADRKAALELTKEDDERRARQFQDIIRGKKWLDVGSGLGGILDLLSAAARTTLAVEPQTGPRENLKKMRYQVYPDIKDIKEQDIEVVTLFHVLEHLTQPLDDLREIRKHMKPGAKIIIEVPHANDFLISFLNNEAFKAFTFWSEHLILHTRQSLTVFLKEAGFKDVVINGFQRYPLANHLYWLVNGKPGGHNYWNFLQTQELEKAYFNLLESLDKTDTLIAIARA